jgi:forespore regulator of the sigma-K checkpoint
VFGFRAMKELKKKLKRRRRPIWSLGMLAVVFLSASAVGIGSASLIQRAALSGSDAAPAAVPVTDAAQADKPVPATASSSRDAALQALAGWKGEVEMILHRVYWCGEENRMLGRRSAEEAAELLKSRRDWEASFEASGRLVMEETMEDPSPACRQTAYIGMDSDGNLSLFDGPPRKDNVVRTFFQLDIHSLESSLSKERLHELAGGIRVSDRDEYNSVLSSFSDFAYRKSKGVMKSEP